MQAWLKQSTSVVISFGPFLDKTDGVTEETGLVSALDHGTTGIKLSKNGGALAIRHATVTATTYDAFGMYRVTLDTTDTGTLGALRVAFNEAATCLPVWADFMILPANIYDSLVGGSDLLDVSMAQILGTAVATPATAGVLDVNVKNAGNTAWASGAIVAGAIASGAITNAKFAAGAIDAAAIAAGAIDNATFAADVGSTAYATNIIALAADKAIQNAALATAANLAAVAGYVDTEVAAIYSRLGAPVGASLSADIAATKADTAALVTGVNVSLIEGGNPAAHTENSVWNADASNHDTASLGDFLAYKVGAPAATLADDIAAIYSAVAAIPTAAANAARVLDTETVDTGLTVRHAIELAAAAVLQKLSGAGTGTETVRNFSDTANLAVVTVDGSGNRSAITYDFSI